MSPASWGLGPSSGSGEIKSITFGGAMAIVEAWLLNSTGAEGVVGFEIGCA